jgi:hypothetical protein
MEAHRLYLQEESLFNSHQHDPTYSLEFDDDEPSQGSPIDGHSLSKFKKYNAESFMNI